MDPNTNQQPSQSPIPTPVQNPIPAPTQYQPAPIQSPPPSNNNSGIRSKLPLLLIVVLLILVLALGGGWFLSAQNTNMTPSPTPTPEENEEIVEEIIEEDFDSETEGWKDFKTQFVSFKHPEDWDIDYSTSTIENSSLVSSINIYQLPRTEGIEIPVAFINEHLKTSKQPDQNLENLKKLLNLEIGEKTQIVGTMFTRAENISVDGISSQKYEGYAVPNYPAEVMPYEILIIAESDNYYYKLSTAPSDGDQNNPSIENFYKLVATFKIN